jgi:lysyl-tRNA synthetase class 2
VGTPKSEQAAAAGEGHAPDGRAGGHDFLPTAPWKNLALRAELLARTRAFFSDRDFLEVETPFVSADVVVDRHLDPLSLVLPHDPRRPDVGRKMWLQTSPEFGMKRLMAAGGRAIYQIARAFRAGEAGPLHNPEFTIVEWYRRGDSMFDGMQLVSDLAEALFDFGPAERLSYAEAFERHVTIDPHRCEPRQLAEVAKRQGISVSESMAQSDRDAWLNLLLAHLVEPHLGRDRPTILYHYPAGQAALAQVHGDPPVAERFELYVRGVELANGYHELLDPTILRRRNLAANQDRVRDGKPPLPEENRLLAAMEHGLADCTGVALGFDRAVMLAAGAGSLAEVMAFPIDRA